MTTSTQVGPQGDRFTSEQINAVKAIFRVTDESEPGRSVAVYRRVVVGGKNPADHILINRAGKSHESRLRARLFIRSRQTEVSVNRDRRDCETCNLPRVRSICNLASQDRFQFS